MAPVRAHASWQKRTKIFINLIWSMWFSPATVINVVCVVALHMGGTLGFHTTPCIIRNLKSLGYRLNSPQFPMQRRSNIARAYIKLRANNRPGDEQSREEPDRTLSFQRSDNGTRDSEFWMDRSGGNPFFQVISSLTPGELVGQFINSASPRVQASLNATLFSFMFFA